MLVKHEFKNHVAITYLMLKSLFLINCVTLSIIALNYSS